MSKWESSDIFPQQKDRYIQADFLAFIDLGNGHEYQKVLVFNFDNKTWKEDADKIIYPNDYTDSVTHWQELPKDPK